MLALLVMGGIAAGLLPVSLMPNIDIPEVTVRITYPHTSARELENVAVTPIRNQLITLSRLQDITSETREGDALIRLRFAYGTRIDYAFLEVNEKIDRAMAYLPREMQRPQVIKASATDIPVYMLNLTLRNQATDDYSEARFLQLSEFADEVIRRRIEQLPQVAMVDRTGRSYPEMQIIPDRAKLQTLNISLEAVEQALKANNVSVGNLLVRDGQYQYHIRFASYLRTPEDVAAIYLKVADRVIQLKDIAAVRIRPQVQSGVYLSDGKPAIGLAIIKQADARVADLRKEMEVLLKQFQADYPDIQVEVSQDQTQLLAVSLASLRQSLIIGSILAFIVMFFFLQDARAPWLIGLTIPTSVIISLMMFYLLGISINIISLSGLILGVGLMIDNSIIVIDNINQYVERGQPVEVACVKGTNEVIRPLISSALTTSAVFIPLIFLSGISGALFYDQAMAITIGLGVSLGVSITLLPTCYRLLYRSNTTTNAHFLQRLRVFNLTAGYKRGMKIVLRYKGMALLGFLLLPLLSWGLYYVLPLQRFPEIRQTESLLHLDWNEGLDIAENKRRVSALLAYLDNTLVQSNSQIGTQQFALDKSQQKETDEASLYLKVASEAVLQQMQQDIQTWLASHYPQATYKLAAPPNLFERLFADNQAALIAQVTLRQGIQSPPYEVISTWREEAQRALDVSLPEVPGREYLAVVLRDDQLVLYEVEHEQLYNTLRSAFQAYEVDVLRSQQQMIPVVLKDAPRKIASVIEETTIRNAQDQLIPVSALVRLTTHKGYAVLQAGKSGEYVPLAFEVAPEEATQLQRELRQHISQTDQLDVLFTGSLFENRRLLRELGIVLGISLLLLYFILAAQFESLVQPFIVLLEVPMDISGALLMLWLWGSSINLLAMIGIIVMSGIIINDSILKIDTINRLRRSGMALAEAVQEGGARRLKPIIMTSLTTILAALPFLLQDSLGADLQTPLALALIGGMLLGTFVSLYFIPLAYSLIYRKAH